MGTHRDQDQFDRAGWRLAFLVPMWLAQFSLELSLMGIFAYRLAETVDRWDEEDKMGRVPVVLFVWQSTNIGFSLISFVLSVFEVARYASERLTPSLMLVTQILKLTLAFAILGLDIVVYINRSDENWSIVGLAIDCALLAAVIIALVYAILTFRRLAATDDYHHPANAKHYGYRGLDETTYASVSRNNQEGTVAADGSTSYPSQTASLPIFQSFTSPRGVGVGDGDGESGDGGAVPLESLKSPTSSATTAGGAPGAATYSHERDTTFDTYVLQQRQSQVSPGAASGDGASPAAAGLTLRDEADRAMTAEFGWSGAAAAVRPKSGSRSPPLPQGSVAGTAAVTTPSPPAANDSASASASASASGSAGVPATFAAHRFSVAGVGGGAFRSDSVASTSSTAYTPTTPLDEHGSPYVSHQQQGQQQIHPLSNRTPSIVLSSGTVASGMPVAVSSPATGGSVHSVHGGGEIGRSGSNASMRAGVFGAAAPEGPGMMMMMGGGGGGGSGLGAVPEGAEYDDDEHQRQTVAASRGQPGSDGYRDDQRALLG